MQNNIRNFFLANIIIFSLLTSQATAETNLTPDRVYFPIASKHFDVDSRDFGLAEWNELNYGVVLTWEDRGSAKIDLGAGAFKNSFGDFSLYLSAAKMFPVMNSNFEVGFFGGFADYKTNATHMKTQLGGSNVVVLAGLIGQYKNIFFQILPSGTQKGSRLGFVALTGATFSIGN